MRLILYILPFLLLLFVPFWPDPDATGTFNTVCKGSDIAIPPLAKIIFSMIPCSILAWKIVHLFLLAGILWVFSKEYSVSILGLLGYSVVFLLTFEDDLLAFLPILVYGIFVLNSRKQFSGLSWEQLLRSPLFQSLLIVGLFLAAFLGLFVWKGAFLIMSFLLAYLIYPRLTVVPFIVYLIISGFNTWGGASEKLMGAGFVFANIAGLIILYYIWKDKDYSWKDEYWLLTSLSLLVFIEPKWGEWLIIPTAFLLQPIIARKPHVRFFGMFMYILFIAVVIFTSFPSQKDVMVINEAVKIQDQNYILLNDWGVGHYLEFYGGSPSQKGGYNGFQDANNVYWLGPDRGCHTIFSGDALFLQKC